MSSVDDRSSFFFYPSLELIWPRSVVVQEGETGYYKYKIDKKLPSKGTEAYPPVPPHSYSQEDAESIAGRKIRLRKMIHLKWANAVQCCFGHQHEPDV